MVDGNTIKFGYGTVCVGSNYQGEVTFRSIQPPQKVGSSLPYLSKEITYFNDLIAISMLKHYQELKEKLQELDGPAVITIGEYILDFSNFNRKSVDVVLDHAYGAYCNYLRLCAC